MIGFSSPGPVPGPAIPFGQSLPGVIQTAPGSSTAGFGGALTTSAPVAQSPPALTFSSPTTPACNIPFGSCTRAPVPSYPGATPQPTFGATDGQQTGVAKPSLAPSFGSTFPFGSPAPPAPPAGPAPIPHQPGFGSAARSGFRGLKLQPLPLAPHQHPASTQPAFGSTTAVSSFGAPTTWGFGATTQTTSSGTSSSVFGSTTSSPFAFRGSAGPAGSVGFGMSMAAPHSSSTTGAFGFGAGQSGTTGSTAPFGGGLSQNSLGAPGQSTPFAFHVASTPQNTSVLAGEKVTCKVSPLEGSHPTSGRDRCRHIRAHLWLEHPCPWGGRIGQQPLLWGVLSTCPGLCWSWNL
ncbi:hypothetical protein MC885_009590 [Smutsia gigantea]|nr:hypothetical protein MC885_009590 [Smutsia gigantea]